MPVEALFKLAQALMLIIHRLKTTTEYHTLYLVILTTFNFQRSMLFFSSKRLNSAMMIICKPVLIPLMTTLFLSLGINGDNQKSAFKLYDLLLKYYDSDLVPSKTSEVIDVNITFNLMALLHFDATEETLITVAWLSIRWNDFSLKWDENPEYKNIPEIFLQQRRVWKPDLRLWNSVETLKSLGSEDNLVNVKRNGNVIWEPGHRFKTSCSLDTSMYPFDSQRCSIVFSAWMHFGHVVKLISLYDKILFDDFQGNGEWELVTSRAHSEYLINPDGYLLPQYIVTLTLKRRALYYALTICVPILVLSILNCLVYLLPPDSGEKISFCLTVLLAYMVYISFLGDNLPRTSRTTSYMVVYLSSMICLSFLSVLNSVVVLFFWHRSEVREEGECKDDYGFINTTSLCMACVNRKWSTIKSRNSGACYEEDTAESEDKPRDRKRVDMKTIAYALDKFFCIIMVILTLTATVVITTLILKSTYAEKH